ncbi:formate channel [Bacteroidales bacterium]|nr:formate channel [Bacteroidales bacterium]
MNYYTPKEIASEFSAFGISKTKLPLVNFSLLAILGGCFIAFGGLLSLYVAGGMPGVLATNPGIVKFVAGALFPVGLIMVSVAGADLFTSDCAAMTIPFMEKKIKFRLVLKILILSYVFNFIGTQIVAYYLSAEIGLLDSNPWKDYLHKMANNKVNSDFYTIFIKGIAANWLVCLGTWMGFAGKDIASKAIGIWIPVMIFVSLGYEHSIANMFFVPAAIYSGAAITWGSFIVNNLIPATLGNFVGGAVFVGMVYWRIYLKDK